MCQEELESVWGKKSKVSIDVKELMFVDIINFLFDVSIFLKFVNFVVILFGKIVSINFLLGFFIV